MISILSQMMFNDNVYLCYVLVEMLEERTTVWVRERLMNTWVLNLSL